MSHPASIHNSGVKMSRASQMTLTSLLLYVLLALTFIAAVGAAASRTPSNQDSCSRQKSQLSCVMGCYKCAQAYGRKLYDMGSCCVECERTQALLINNGPEHCSPRFFTSLVNQWQNRAGRK